MTNVECFRIERPARRHAAHGIWASDFGIFWVIGYFVIRHWAAKWRYPASPRERDRLCT